MKKLLPIIYLVALSGLIQSCSQVQSYSGSGYTAPEQPKTAEELRAELLVSEQRAPEEYLRTAGTYRRNFIDQLVLEGDIANTASLATFKDPVLTVRWYSKTKTEIDTKQYQIYELVRAHHTTHFKLKTDAPDCVESVSMGVLDATPVE
ncbi:hypothetical protein GO988_17410 [Hymenobacter sp. HMF4947]|uniref:Lipoprotein n=1 Tax=Hymenobacter ginkgonis TaxID=2682976 RepID=A0A7K1TI78_9BACT|nr:hypothetical protein [Hymenobacter ginkgonis]MVN78110.1 hypothetical protein [Hymenobacter ginkgonis]